MVILQFRGHLVRQYRVFVVDSWAWNYVSYITVICVQVIPILSLLIFMPSLYNFYIYLSPLIFNHNS